MISHHGIVELLHRILATANLTSATASQSRAHRQRKLKCTRHMRACSRISSGSEEQVSLPGTMREGGSAKRRTSSALQLTIQASRLMRLLCSIGPSTAYESPPWSGRQVARGRTPPFLPGAQAGRMAHAMPYPDAPENQGLGRLLMHPK